MNLNNLIIEVTRRCNMECEHCMRGDAQNKDITREILVNFLVDNDIEYISSVTFTGGEPSLNIQAIEDFMEICKGNHIEVGGFYVATNGKKITDKFLMVLMKLWLFCDNNEISAVEVSRSQWHDYEGQDEAGIEKLKILKFASERPMLNPDNIINESHGIEWNYNRDYKGRQIESKDHIDPDDPEIYLNVNGNILSSCDLSYESQDVRVSCLKTSIIGSYLVLCGATTIH